MRKKWTLNSYIYTKNVQKNVQTEQNLYGLKVAWNLCMFFVHTKNEQTMQNLQN